MLFECGARYTQELEENELDAFVNMNQPGGNYQLTGIQDGKTTVMNFTSDHPEDEQGLHLFTDPSIYLCRLLLKPTQLTSASIRSPLRIMQETKLHLTHRALQNPQKKKITPLGRGVLMTKKYLSRGKSKN